MATVDRWLLPDGIEEVLPPEAARIETARRRVLDLFHRWGYELVITPHVEFLESLLTGSGQDLDLRTFKVTDPLSGRQMGFRADITPQVARVDAHTLRRTGPSRLCYAGSVLHAKPQALATSRSPIQLGAELYGDASAASDLEIISLMVETLELADVPNVHMDLGHVGIYRGLAKAAGLAGDLEQRLFDALQRKAMDELAELTGTLEPGLAAMIRALARLCGGARRWSRRSACWPTLRAKCVMRWLRWLGSLKSWRRAIRKSRFTSIWVNCAATTITPEWCLPRSYQASVSQSHRADATMPLGRTSAVRARLRGSLPISRRS